MSSRDLSVVVPVYNERESVEALHARIIGVLDTMPQSAELVYVDDGSTDGTTDLLEQLARKDGRVKVVVLRKNFGQTAAMAAGFRHAVGKVVITLDADLQNDPADMPRMLDVMEKEQCDIVSGWRKERQDGFLMRCLPSLVANKIISVVTGVHLHDYGCTLKAYKHDVAQELHLYGQMHRFIPALASMMGVRVVELPVRHWPRRFGRSKYGIGRTTRVILDLINLKFMLSYSTRPSHVFGMVGLAGMAAGTVMCFWLSWCKFMLHEPIGHRPLLLFAVLLILVGVQLVTMGLLAELVVRTYHESQNKPIYAIRRITCAEGDEVLPDERLGVV